MSALARSGPGVLGVTLVLVVTGSLGEAGWGGMVLACVAAALAIWLAGTPRGEPAPAPARHLAASAWAVGLGLAFALCCLAHPSALWGALALLMVGLVARFVRLPRAALVGLGFVAVLGLGWAGARVERSPETAGVAHTGPLHGTRALQSTGIRIDGYGPFDLTVNDWLDPEGTQGYDAAGFATFVQRVVRSMAEVQLAEGPLRARAAFAEAETGVRDLAALAEREDAQGIWLRAGTRGPGSRVEFVCPAARVEAGPSRRESTVRDSCPRKYGQEASAGASVTGRWPGYTEVRGHARASLANLFGAAGGEDGPSRSWEVWVWVSLLAVAGWGAAATAREGREEPAWGVVVAWALATFVGVLALASADALRVAWSARALGDARTWIPALGLLALARWRGGCRPAWVANALAMLGLALAVAVGRVGGPREFALGGIDFGRVDVPVVGWIRAGADGVARVTGADVFVVEGMLAAAVGAALAFAVAAAVAGGPLGDADADGSSRRREVLVSLLVLAAFVGARKLAPNLALLPCAIALAFVAAPRTRWAQVWRARLLELFASVCAAASVLAALPDSPEVGELVGAALLGTWVLAASVWRVWRGGSPEPREPANPSESPSLAP